MPPAREMRLWMRRALAQEGRPESDLHITITLIKEGRSDKNGAWLIVKGTGAFLGLNGWTIKMRPDTQWPVVESEGYEGFVCAAAESACQ
jgi:hypothetical protein